MSRIDAHFVAAGKYHDIDFARLEVLKLLAEHPEIRTTVACDYGGIERLDQCRMLVTYTCDLMPTPEQLTAIRAWLERGGKWLALHGTNSILRFTEQGVDCPDERPDVMELLGTQFVAHPPIGVFSVEVVNRDHALTRGIDDFDVVDELYLSRTTAPITARTSSVTPSTLRGSSFARCAIASAAAFRSASSISSRSESGGLLSPRTARGLTSSFITIPSRG